VGRIHINRGRVGEERGGKEMDRCPLTRGEKEKTHSSFDLGVVVNTPIALG
jgi:hypothetical protein